MTVPDEERRPIPLDAVRREYREFLRGQGIDPDTWLKRSSGFPGPARV